MQGKLDTALSEQERLRNESDKSSMLSTRSREELRKLQEEVQDLKDSLDRALLQLSKAKEHEEKLKEDLDKQSLDVELLRERYDKAQIEHRRAVNEREKLDSELVRVTFELERITSQHSKSQVVLEKLQEDFARKQVRPFVYYTATKS